MLYSCYMHQLHARRKIQSSMLHCLTALLQSSKECGILRLGAPTCPASSRYGAESWTPVGFRKFSISSIRRTGEHCLEKLKMESPFLVRILFEGCEVICTWMQESPFAEVRILILPTLHSKTKMYMRMGGRILN